MPLLMLNSSTQRIATLRATRSCRWSGARGAACSRRTRRARAKCAWCRFRSGRRRARSRWSRAQLHCASGSRRTSRLHSARRSRSPGATRRETGPRRASLARSPRTRTGALRLLVLTLLVATDVQYIYVYTYFVYSTSTVYCKLVKSIAYTSIVLLSTRTDSMFASSIWTSPKLAIPAMEPTPVTSKTFSSTPRTRHRLKRVRKVDHSISLSFPHKIDCHQSR